MIRYTLVCEADHEFDGWFRSAADFEAQAERGLVACAICGSTKVGRGLMAPNVITARSRVSGPGTAGLAIAEGADAAPAGPDARQAVASLPEPTHRAMIEALADLKRKMLANSDDVGNRFAEEARKMHYGETPERGIHGQATGEEARALVEEGIDVVPLPILPDEFN